MTDGGQKGNGQLSSSKYFKLKRAKGKLRMLRIIKVLIFGGHLLNSSLQAPSESSLRCDKKEREEMTAQTDENCCRLMWVTVEGRTTVLKSPWKKKYWRAQ